MLPPMLLAYSTEGTSWPAGAVPIVPTIGWAGRRSVRPPTGNSTTPSRIVQILVLPPGGMPRQS